MKNLILAFSLIFIIFKVDAEGVVIVNASNKNEITLEMVSGIYLGRLKSFPDGTQAIPISINESKPITAEFNSKILNKSQSQLKAYWSKLIFTGKGASPKEVDNSKETIRFVENNSNAIGYIDSSELNNSVRVIAKF